MATDPKTTTAAPRFETEVISGDKTLTATVGGTGTTVTQKDGSGATVDLDMATGKPLVADPDDIELDDEGNPLEPAPKEPDGDPEPTPEEGEPLPEWDAKNVEVMEAYDARYFKDGKLDMPTLGGEFWREYAKAEDKSAVTLPKATLDYLNDRLGLSPEFVKEVSDGLVANQANGETALYARVGGKEQFDAMAAWGREGGYTPAQRTRFNEALKKGGADLEDAMDVLQARYQTANPSKPTTPALPPSGKRPSVPARDVTKAATGTAGGGDTFSSHDEYSTAWAAGLAKKKAASSPAEKREADQNLNVLRAKARRSRFN